MKILSYLYFLLPHFSLQLFVQFFKPHTPQHTFFFILNKMYSEVQNIILKKYQQQCLLVRFFFLCLNKCATNKFNSLAFVVVVDARQIVDHHLQHLVLTNDVSLMDHYNRLIQRIFQKM